MRVLEIELWDYIEGEIRSHSIKSTSNIHLETSATSDPMKVTSLLEEGGARLVLVKQYALLTNQC